MSLWACAGVFALRAAPWTSEFISTNRSSQSTRDAFCVHPKVASTHLWKLLMPMVTCVCPAVAALGPRL